MKRKLLLCAAAFMAVIAISFTSLKSDEAKSFHTPLERTVFDGFKRTPIQSGEYFLGSINCQSCHGHDTLHIANVDGDGVDVNLYDDWESSMMANSAIDPLWRAKVSHEILVDPGHSLELQTKCTSCHAPMGHFTAIYHGATSYTIEDLKNDTLGLNGVACTGCHEIGTQNLGSVFSGDVPYDTSKKEFGPFMNPVIGPMQLYVGLIPTFSEHMNTSQVCASCHTLITKTTDLYGNYTGGTFVEQATYHEWLNSALAQDNIVCQKCHMPQVADSVVIANNILALPPRAPFNQHQFVGGNYFMIKLIKENKEALDAKANEVNFDSTLAAAYRMLTKQSLKVKIYLDSIESDTAFFRFQITNKAGHKFPSGYPSRRAIVQFVVLNSSADTVFQSGVFDGDYEVKNIDPVFEPHYNVINNNSQSQIYEMVMADVNGNPTTVLERAASFLKDNRIPPEGFVTDFISYDTIAIIGDALNDYDFNKTGNTEGSGKDYVHYHIPLNGITGLVNVYAKVFYQAVPPRWVQELFSYSSDDIDAFKSMYNAADRSPIIAAHDSMLNVALQTSVANISIQKLLRVINSLSSNSITIENNSNLTIYSVDVYGTGGTSISSSKINSDASSIPVSLPNQNGIYFLELRTNEGRYIFKVAKQ